jgi:hypothetical protein
MEIEWNVKRKRLKTLEERRHSEWVVRGRSIGTPY